MTRIGTLDVDEASARVRPLLSGDTPIEALHSAPTYLASPDILFALGITDSPDAAPIEVAGRDGERRVVTLPAVAARGRLVSMRAAAGVADPLPSSRPGAYYWFAPLGNAMYFQINASMNQDGEPSLSAVTRDLFRQFDAGQAKALIVDLRNNNGGNVDRNRDLVAGVAARPSLRERGRLVVIVGRRTFSAGLDAVVELKRIAQPIVVGESPRGLPAKPGNRETFVLPNSKLVVDYSEKIDSLAFRSSRGTPMPVDIEAPPRFEAAIAGKDPALDAIQALLKTAVK